MMIKQLSLFVENRPGALSAVCQVLKNNRINIRTLSLADTQQFGILRLLVKEYEKAKEALEAAGLVVKVTDVLALTVPDHPGGRHPDDFRQAQTFGRIYVCVHLRPRGQECDGVPVRASGAGRRTPEE